MTKIKLYTLPNAITLLNLLCGSAAVSFVFADEPRTAFWLICAAAAFDFLDGFAARALKQYSAVGVQLDSLADMVSFGFAPAAMLFKMFLAGGGSTPVAWLPLLLAAFSALRLAKFNVDDSQHEEFVGMPTPACALLVASLSASLVPGPWWVLALAGVLCWLLVSPIRMFSLKFRSWGFRANALRYCFLAAALVCVALAGVAGIAAAIALYLLVSTTRHFISEILFSG